jgi:hypothetical protein
VNRWKYYSQLLNVRSAVVSDRSPFEVEISVANLKEYSDKIE